MDKENNEILKEEESLNASILNSDRNVIKAINSEIFKEKLREFMNKNWYYTELYFFFDINEHLLFY